MELTSEQIQLIRKDLVIRGLKSENLINELTDHVATAVEAQLTDREEFQQVYSRVIEEFAPMNFHLIQQVTERLLFNKNYIKMKIAKFTSIIFLVYSTFVIAVAFFLPDTAFQAANALRIAGLVGFTTATLIGAYYLIAFQNASATRQLFYSIGAILLFSLFMSAALRELKLPVQDSLIAVGPTAIVFLLVSFVVYYIQKKRTKHANF